MLTNATVKAAAAAARPYKLHDAGGLHLFVRPNGRRTWRMKFRLAKREQLLTFGDFPAIGLADARELRDQARTQLRRGEDPRTKAHQDAPDCITFEAIGRRWHAHNLPRWSATHAGDVLASLERDVFPAIGTMPIGGITTPVVLAALRAIEGRGSIETARRVRQRISAVFAFAISEGLASVDPAAIVAKALAPLPAQRRQPALLELDQARRLLADVDQLEAAQIAKLASRFLALTAVRSAVLRGAAWSEFEDLDGSAPLWRIPAARMKLTVAKKADAAGEHLVPLSPAAAEILRLMRHQLEENGYDTRSEGALAFPGRRGRQLGEAAIADLYVRAGYAGRHVPHGWRATFSTILNEAFPDDRAAIDRALAHAPKDRVEAAYNRAQQLDRRRRLFDAWAALLTG